MKKKKMAKKPTGMDAKAGGPSNGYFKNTGSAKMLQSSGKSQMKFSPKKKAAVKNKKLGNAANKMFFGSK